MKRIAIVLILAFAATAAQAIDWYNTGDELFVLAPSGLRLRKAPEQSSSVLATVPYGASVTALSPPDGDRFEVDGIEGIWLKVKFKNQEGYLFDGYLSQLPAPAENCNSLLEYAEMNFKKAAGPISLTEKIEYYEINDTVWFYTYKHFSITVKMDYGYESYQDIIHLNGVSVVEAWLITRQCYKKEIAESLKNLEAAIAQTPGRCFDTMPEDGNTEAYKRFVPSEDGQLFLPFYLCEMACYEGIYIHSCDGWITISQGGGC